MKYGQLPEDIGTFEVDCKEMMFYQYLPIKLIGSNRTVLEERLLCFNKIVLASCSDYIDKNGIDNFVNSYVYLTAKHLYQTPNNSFNRMGYHSDGFLTDDINYIWCDKYPTIFNHSNFNLTLDDKISMQEMEFQAEKVNEITYNENSLLRLDQFNIHKVAEIKEGGFRTFLKISISKDKYDLIGNSHNHLLNYNWEMKPRNSERNIPQSYIKE